MKLIITDKKKVLDHNPKIDQKLVSEYEKIEKELQRMGVDTCPRYRFGIPIPDKNTLPTLMITRSNDQSQPPEE